LLEERPLSPFDVLDIALGALDARLRPRSLAIDLTARRTHPMNARLAGYAAVTGGALILVAIGLGVLLSSQGGQYLVFLYPVAAVALLVALIGLSAVQGRQRPVLTWSAVAVPVAALVLSLLGMIGMAVRGDQPIVAGISSWYLWSLGILGLIVGSILFAAATAIVGVFSRPAALTLLAGSVLTSVTFIPVGFGLVESPPFIVGAVFGGLLFAGGWAWLGYAAATQRPIQADASAA
jgi:hypothetical protein